MHKFKGNVPLAERILLSPDEASDLTGIGVTTIRAALKSKALKGRENGTRKMIKRVDLDAWVDTMPLA
ncbi:excisionase family DNA binding protein [Bradyrhizobium japonicum]|uniref:helix-turn-helix domain-containing protein n=1 Tax=Bradyrhizobium TaxID=374 RepID=UPI00041023B7|nr:MULTISPECIES: helix-turn-helix domain-containing protein [Bradyrhizobium]MBR0884638.1 helix-turn-helix domain-containing protein [Bradyrhizobium liaoningense]MBR0998315.1 helix-turn-helix domain-containing protein [Bradyrhizobium liaoningense]MBR1071289.1 helix-turn-helix domain-containing protein [Bradyrhizobium liaoningense]MCP1739700.1 excisionase family DNA binding protein [Bradyrhizobium japonicum]MCP1777885.1 excisionase family DNA binding protein [Bradyrhizobium japonicum]